MIGWEYTSDLTVKEVTKLLQETQTDYIDRYSDVKLLDNPTRMYNCHSYVWYKRDSKTNKIWLNLAPAMKYMTDTSYQVVGNYSASASYPSNAGGPVFYQTMSGTQYINDHSAYLIRASTKLMKSKWVDGPLMQHEQTHCPYYVPGYTNFVLYQINPAYVT